MCMRMRHDKDDQDAGRDWFRTAPHRTAHAPHPPTRKQWLAAMSVGLAAYSRDVGKCGGKRSEKHGVERGGWMDG